MKKKIITLTTDFGSADAYSAVMKGVILKINPDVSFIDVTHCVKPYSVFSGNYILYSAFKYFPENSIHIAVVDPGVGSGSRDAIIVEFKKHIFICPDNGLLSLVLSEQSDYYAYKINEKKLSDKLKNKRVISNTFHGRDVFAPAAAFISMNNNYESFSEKTDSIYFLPFLKNIFRQNEILTKILHIDSFGNIILNIKKNTLANRIIANIKIKNKNIDQFVKTYSAIKKIACLFGSENFLEISMKEKSAAEFLNCKIEEDVTVELI
ncbi:MAG TPA: SAM-dependent chlorinase/fluorinase [bacterium]|nr:SAM-dependent chlorinase/fluorinase [bacterium]HPN31558.1 SAM-dependent chlorinase/fluorinase [bacterium]